MNLELRASVSRQQPSRAFYLRLANQKELLERRRIRHRRVERAEDSDRRIELLERFFLNHCGDALADAAGARVLVDDQDAAAVAGDGEDRAA